MKVKLIIHNKAIDEYGNMVEVKLWQTESSVDKPHGYKYSLVYIENGKRVIGYDNAERQGDHRHYGQTTESYHFTGIEGVCDGRLCPGIRQGDLGMLKIFFVSRHKRETPV
jgi:hypothetical protein